MTAICKVVCYNTEKVEFAGEAASAFIFGVMKSSFAVKLNDVGEEVRIAVEEIFVSVSVEEAVSSRTSQKCV